MPSLHPQPDPPTLSLTGVGKTYDGSPNGSAPALAPTDLHIAAGEFVAIVGRSGCGKSTLLRLIAGLEHPTTGHIETGAANLRYVFQNYAESLLPWRTAANNVRFGLRHGSHPQTKRTKPQEDALIADLLHDVGIGGTGARYPAQLSGGMQQRLAIARALASSPDVLLLDEPFSAVDALSRARMQDLLLRLWADRALTALFVTHDIEEAIYLADRIIVLAPGGRGIIKDIRVPLPRPRHQVTTREDPTFLHLRRTLLADVLGDTA